MSWRRAPRSRGRYLHHLLQTEADKVFYLDPDIAVFNSLQPLADMLEQSSILLTPHQLTPESSRDAIVDNELCSLSHGTYNLGFLGVRNDEVGRGFAEWWRSRLLEYCRDDRTAGIFVDQKWCDLVPAMFDRVGIVRDPGYNVASWNLSHRTVSVDEQGAILVNLRPLRFFHYTKLGPIGDTMTRKYARDNIEVYELWAWYRRMVERFAEPRIPEGWWQFGTFDNGVPISKVARQMYRSRPDLKAAFPAPFSTSGASYFGWLKDEGLIS